MMGYTFYDAFGAALQLTFVFMVLPLVVGLFITKKVIQKQELEKQNRARRRARRREMERELFKEKGYF